MEYECSPLSWEFCYQEEQGMEELSHFLYTTLELEATIASAKEEITTRECELNHVNDLLSIAIKERNEAQAKCQKLMLEKLELQQELQQHQQLVQAQQQQQNEDDFQGDISEKHHSPTPSSDCEESSMPLPLPSPGGISTSSHPTPLEVTLELAQKRPLPEKGKLLKAVVEAGPLLQTILLAGPLPQWQHPPPQLNSIEIPPVAISSPTASSLVLPLDSSKKSFSFSKKRELVRSDAAAADECPVSKCRKVIQQSTTTPTTAASHHSLPTRPSFS